MEAKAGVTKREIFGWCLFDVANSSYTTTIITVFFGRIFAEVIVGPDASNPSSFSNGNLLWSWLLGASWMMTALLGPFFGAMSDVGGRRKQFLAASVMLCALATAMLYTAGPGMIAWAALLVVVSNFGFSLSENFIAAFLPHISTPKNIGKISGWSWGLGYLGGIGSIILCAAVVNVEEFTPATFDSLRWVGPLTAAFFVVFSLPTFMFVREPKSMAAQSFDFKAALSNAYTEFFSTFKKLRDYPDLARFLMSFFFFFGGLSIVISFAAIYAAQVVGITGGKWQTIFFLVINLSAAVGAVAFGYIQNKLGALKTVNLTLVVWIATVLMIYFLEDLGRLLGVSDLKLLFIGVANFAGVCLGATQSATRALVGLFSPPSRSGEFFGFWGLAGKLSAVFSVLVFGFLQTILSLHASMLACLTFFAVGLVLNRTVNEGRGRANVELLHK